MADHRQVQDSNGAPEAQADGPREAGPVGVVLALLFLLGLLGGTIYGIVQLAPDETPAKSDPSFIDTLFDNTVVIAAGRVVLLALAITALATAIYILGSIAHRIGKGEWLREAGPFKADVIDLKLGETADYFEDLVDREETVEVLERRLEESDTIIRDLLNDNERLRQALGDTRRTS